MRKLNSLLLFLILAIAAVLRFSFPLWDDGYKSHPDERYIYWVATFIEMPQSAAAFFDPTLNSLNPYRWTPQMIAEGASVDQPGLRQFPYGHLPLYILIFTARSLNFIGQTFPLSIPFVSDLINTPQRGEYDHLMFVGRALAALFDLVSVYTIYLIARKLFDELVALIAAAFTALAVIHIQLSHFGAFDIHLTTFCLLTIFFAIRYVQENHRRDLILASVMMGFAVGSKAAGILLIIPLGASLIIKGLKIKDWRSSLQSLALVSLFSFLSFALTNPFSLIEFITFISQVSFQSSMAQGNFILPYTNQYLNTTPFLYEVEQQAKWMLGFPLTVAAYAGVVAGGWWLMVSFRASINRISLFITHRSSFIILFSWLLPFFLFTAGLQVKYPRYLLPVTPLLIMFGAWAMISLARRWRLMWIVPAATLVSMVVYAFAFINMYSSPHPWLQISQWMYRNIPRQSNIVVEKWDADLPLKIELDGLRRRGDEYNLLEINSFERPDAPLKLEATLRKLSSSDYMAVTSNRVYSVIPRLSDRYPLTSKFYKALLSGKLGFEVATMASRYPTLFGYRIVNDTFAPANLPTPTLALFTSHDLNLGFADESFALYDHPLAMILKNVQRLSAEEMKAIIAP